MKDLSQFIKESSRTRINAKDLDPKEFDEWAKNVQKDGLGATVADLKMQLVERIVAKGMNKRYDDIDVMPVNWDKENDPFFGDEIEKILHEYFHFVKSKEGNIYLAPKKKTSVSAVKRWLGDDFAGTMENPNW